MLLLNKIRQFLKRDVSVSDIMDRFWSMLEIRQDFEWPVPLGYYMNSEGAYVAFSDRGFLYRVDVSFEGNNVVFSEPYTVNVEFVETRGQIRLMEREKGSNEVRFVAIASASVLNRSGEIDSRELFDSFEENFNETQLPDVTLRHIHIPDFYFGKVTRVYRYENLLVTHGIIYLDHPLGEYALERIGDPEWGISIGYLGSLPEIARTQEGIEIPVYKEGVLVEISLLREKEAASLLTGTKITEGVNRMGKSIGEIRKILVDFTNDEKFVDDFVDDLENREAHIRENSLVTREATPEETEEVEEEVAGETETEEVIVDEPEETEEVIIEIGEEELARAVATALEGSSFVQDLQERLGNALSQISTLSAEMAGIREELGQRVSRIEKEDEQRLEEVIEELPVNRRVRNKVVYRPSQQAEVNADVPSDVPDFAELRKKFREERPKLFKGEK